MRSQSGSDSLHGELANRQQGQTRTAIREALAAKMGPVANLPEPPIRVVVLPSRGVD
jgi:hypothetical protein